MLNLKNVIKKDKITDLEKQIEELDKQYEEDVTLPFKKQTGISLPEYLEKKLNLDKEYIVKKVNLEVKLAILKGVD